MEKLRKEQHLAIDRASAWTLQHKVAAAKDVRGRERALSSARRRAAAESLSKAVASRESVGQTRKLAHAARALTVNARGATADEVRAVSRTLELQRQQTVLAAAVNTRAAHAAHYDARWMSAAASRVVDASEWRSLRAPPDESGDISREWGRGGGYGGGRGGECGEGGAPAQLEDHSVVAGTDHAANDHHTDADRTANNHTANAPTASDRTAEHDSEDISEGVPSQPHHGHGHDYHDGSHGGGPDALVVATPSATAPIGPLMCEPSEAASDSATSAGHHVCASSECGEQEGVQTVVGGDEGGAEGGKKGGEQGAPTVVGGEMGAKKGGRDGVENGGDQEGGQQHRTHMRTLTAERGSDGAVDPSYSQLNSNTRDSDGLDEKDAHMPPDG
jgi:hypothetical protein